MSNRRTFLRAVGGLAAGSTILSSTAAGKPGRGRGRGGGRGDGRGAGHGERGAGRGRGFPPSGITSWGDSAPLGEGTVSTFSSVTPSGNPKYVGVHFSEGALSLPSPSDLADVGPGPYRGGVVAQLHGGFWSKLHSLDFPSNTPAPIEYTGLGWNSAGHLPHGVYSKPHFDVHFYFESASTVADIGPGQITAEDVAAGMTPDGYRLIEGGAVIPNMGAHMAPEDAPEFDDRTDAGDWQQTLIWGAADVDDDPAYELNFVEPMVTVDYIEGVDGVARHDVPQPDAYPQDGHYPTGYEVRDLGDGGHAVVMRDFAYREA